MYGRRVGHFSCGSSWVGPPAQQASHRCGPGEQRKGPVYWIVWITIYFANDNQKRAPEPVQEESVRTEVIPDPVVVNFVPRQFCPNCDIYITYTLITLTTIITLITLITHKKCVLSLHQCSSFFFFFFKSLFSYFHFIVKKCSSNALC